jgi:phosphoglycolate phosphatase
MKKKLAVIFPGIGYHKDKPLLYYATKLAANRGYEIINIEYHDMPKGIKGDAGLMKKAVQTAFAQTEEQLTGVDFSEYGNILFIGKSIGTVALARYASDHGIDSKQVWYTPVEATFLFGSKNVMAFIGDDDTWSDVAAVKRLSFENDIKLYSYPGCDHSLESELVDRNIAILRDVMHITEYFIDERGLVR